MRLVFSLIIAVLCFFINDVGIRCLITIAGSFLALVLLVSNENSNSFITNFVSIFGNSLIISIYVAIIYLFFHTIFAIKSNPILNLEALIESILFYIPNSIVLLVWCLISGVLASIVLPIVLNFRK